MSDPFETPILDVEGEPGAICGPWRKPRNMLSGQSYDDHSGIHDDETARKLGFRGGTVEGPTHFSLIAPLGVALFGSPFLASGCISAHYRTPCYEGDETQAIMRRRPGGDPMADIQVLKPDDTEVLSGTVSVSPERGQTALEGRLQAIGPLIDRLILADIKVGERTSRRRVRMDADEKMGELYPFSLREKLARITEPSPWYDPATAESSPWGRAIIPFEMISVLSQYVAAEDPFPVRRPVVGLFADQEIRLHGEPLFVGEDYELDREVVAMSGSRKTESLWIRTRIYRRGGDDPKATLLLNQAYLKDSYPGYTAHA